MLQKHLRDEKETIMCVSAIPCARAPSRAFGARYFGRVHSPVWVGKINHTNGISSCDYIDSFFLNVCTTCSQGKALFIIAS